MPPNDLAERSLTDLASLSGRCALVTGGARGIGQACARRLAEAGARVMIADIDWEAADQAAKELDGDGTKTVMATRLDVTDPASVAAVIEQTVADLGGLDILVNNAGIFPLIPVLSLSDEDWTRVLRTNVDGAFYCARGASRHMVESGSGGVIVNMASVQAFRATAPGLAAYNASKGALVALTRALALELGPSGVRVLAVAPTLCETPGFAKNKAVFEALGVDDVVAQLSSTLPLRRAALPDDVARVVVFCASDMAALMTGDTLAVDAGHLTL